MVTRAGRDADTREVTVLRARLAVLFAAVCCAAALAGCSDSPSSAAAPDDVPAVSDDTTVSDFEPDPSVPSDATEPDPVTGAPIPAAGTQARDDMEAAEIDCWDSGRTDCADAPGAYLDDPGSYP